MTTIKKVNSSWGFYKIFPFLTNPNIIDDSVDDVITIDDLKRKRTLFEHNYQYRTRQQNFNALVKYNSYSTRVLNNLLVKIKDTIPSKSDTDKLKELDLLQYNVPNHIVIDSMKIEK